MQTHCCQQCVTTLPNKRYFTNLTIYNRCRHTAASSQLLAVPPPPGWYIFKFTPNDCPGWACEPRVGYHNLRIRKDRLTVSQYPSVCVSPLSQLTDLPETWYERQGALMEEASTSETSVSFNQTTRRNTSKDSRIMSCVLPRTYCFIWTPSFQGEGVELRVNVTSKTWLWIC
jgi:hypothetical protein